MLPEIEDGRVMPAPAKVLRGSLRSGVKQVLVQWWVLLKMTQPGSRLTSSLLVFPSFQLEDELLFEKGSDVMWGQTYSCRVKSN